MAVWRYLGIGGAVTVRGRTVSVQGGSLMILVLTRYLSSLCEYLCEYAYFLKLKNFIFPITTNENRKIVWIIVYPLSRQ